MTKRPVVVVVAAVLAVALIVGGGLAAGLTLVGDDGREGSQPVSDDVDPTATAEAPQASEEPSSGTGQGARTPPEPALAPFYDQQLAWEPCPQESGAQCSTLTVPVDYAKPTTGSIEVALLRVPASEEATGSLVVNPGGPGASGTSYAALAGQAFGTEVTAALDVVGFDPRGTGSSNPVDCLTDEELDEFLAQDPDPDTDAEGEAFEAAQQTFFEGCVERSDDLLGHVSTLEAARDMDVLRAALEEPELRYFGASYGTKLGATYAELFADRVGRFVLDGAVDVSLSSRELSLGQAEGFEVALRAYVENCVDNTPECFLGDDVEEGLGRITDLVEATDADPLPTGSDRELTEGLAFYGIVTPLYNRDYWPLLDQGLRTAFDGDGTGLLLLADAYASRQGGTYTDNSAEAIYAINCLDDPFAVTADEVPDEVADFEEVSPTFGRVFAWGLVGCEGIEVEASEPAPDIEAKGAAPILVVGTTRDPATPYAWSEALADQLDSGVLLTRDGDGHTGYRAGNECIDTAVEDYLLQGEVPEDGATC